MRWNLRNTLGPIFLITVCPIAAVLMWYTNTALNGSFKAMYDLFAVFGFLPIVQQIFAPIMWGSPIAWKIILIFAASQLLFMRVLPGKAFHGPITPKGNVPVYKANGVITFFTTVALFCIASFYLHLFDAAIIYDNFGAIIGALNILSLSVCLLLYFKGKYAPSTNDSGVTGNFIFDYYWGTELYPKVLGFNIKQFITCRFGMMSWALILLSYAAKQQQTTGLSDSMVVAIIIQMVYLTKFYIWETGYWRSLDIMHDRAGFYICWGCFVWVPSVYTSPTMYLVLHPNHLGVFWATAITVLGVGSVLINYFADRQRQVVRLSEGNCKVWGKPPVVTLATYRTTEGEEKQNLLLASGWWGIARHFHYVPEILGTFFWSVPALFTHFAPYFYVCFLTVLLLDRAFRDDARCRQKYGSYWEDYCRLVPYKIVPFII